MLISLSLLLRDEKKATCKAAKQSDFSRQGSPARRGETIPVRSASASSARTPFPLAASFLSFLLQFQALHSWVLYEQVHEHVKRNEVLETTKRSTILRSLSRPFSRNCQAAQERQGGAFSWNLQEWKLLWGA